MLDALLQCLYCSLSLHVTRGVMQSRGHVFDTVIVQNRLNSLLMSEELLSVRQSFAVIHELQIPF